MALTATAPRVLADFAPRTWATHLTMALIGAGVVGVLAQVKVFLPGNPVPLTGQTLGVLLVAGALGWGRGVLAMVMYAGLGIAGVPWFASASAGFQFAAFGYVLGFVAAAAVVGTLAERGMTRRVSGVALIFAIGSVTIYAVGASWLAVVVGMGWSQAFTLGVVPFVVGDVVKAAIAAALLPSAWALSRRFN